MILMSCSHIDLQFIPLVQFQVRVVRSNNCHPLGTGLCCSFIRCFVGTGTITNRGQDTIVRPFISLTRYTHIGNFHILTTSYILNPSPQQGIDSVVVRRFLLHILAIISIEIPIVDPSDGVLVGEHESMSSWNVELRILLVCLAHIFVVNLEGLLELIHGKGQTISIWIDIFPDDVGNNSLYFAVMSSDKDIVGHPFAIFLFSRAVIQTISNRWLYSATDRKLTHERIKQGQTKLIINRQLSTLGVLVVVRVVVRPSFQDRQVLNSLLFTFSNLVARLEVVRGNLEQVCIDIVYRIDTNPVKVSSRIIGYNATEVHHKVQPVELLSLNSWIRVVKVVS